MSSSGCRGRKVETHRRHRRVSADWGRCIRVKDFVEKPPERNAANLGASGRYILTPISSGSERWRRSRGEIQDHGSGHCCAAATFACEVTGVRHDTAPAWV